MWEDRVWNAGSVGAWVAGTVAVLALVVTPSLYAVRSGDAGRCREVTQGYLYAE